MARAALAGASVLVSAIAAYPFAYRLARRQRHSRCEAAPGRWGLAWQGYNGRELRLEAWGCCHLRAAHDDGHVRARFAQVPPEPDRDDSDRRQECSVSARS